MSQTRSTAWKMAEVGFTAVSGLAQFALLARELALGEFGILSSALALGAVFQVLADAGLGTSTNVHIARARAKDDQLQVARLVRQSLVMVLVWSALLAAGNFLFAGQLAGLQNAAGADAEFRTVSVYLFAVTGQQLISQILAGMERFKTLALLNIAFRTVQLIAVGAVLLLSPSPLLVLLALSGAGLIALMTGAGLTLRAAPLPAGEKALDRALIARVARYGRPILVNNASFYLYTKVDTLMLGWFWPQEEVGRYGFADRVIGIPLMALWAYTAVIGPRFARLAASDDPSPLLGVWKREVGRVLFGAAVVCLGVAICTPPVTRFVFPVHQGSIFLVQILGFVLLARAVGGVSGALLVNTGHARPLALSTTTGALANVLLNFLFVPRYGAPGVIAATVLAHSGSCLLTSWLAYKNCPRDRAPADADAPEPDPAQTADPQDTP